MSVILMALAMVGFIAVIIFIFVIVHKRDQKAETAQRKNIS